MRRAAAVSAFCFLLSACGESTIKGDDVEKFVRSKVKDPSVVTSITCPDDRPAKKGDSFKCTIELRDGSQEVATIEQADNDGHVRLVSDLQSRLAKGTVTLRRENLERLVSTQLPDVQPGTAKCPAKEPIKLGHITKCTVRSSKDRKTYVVSIVQFDQLGNVRIAGVEPRG